MSEQAFDDTVYGAALPLHQRARPLGPASGPWIVLGAHWDTRPIGRCRSRTRRSRGEPVLGANDGASGVAVLLEVARVLGQGGCRRSASRSCCSTARTWAKAGTSRASAAARATTCATLTHPRPQLAIVVDMVGDREPRALLRAELAQR